MALPTPLYTEGELTTAAACGAPVFSSPIRSTTAHYILTQDFMALSGVPELVIDASHPDYPSYKLVSEGPKQDVGGGLVKWTRTYAQVPKFHDEFESYAYSFIGFQGVWTVGNSSTSVQATGRPRLTHVVTSRVRHEYFFTDKPLSIEVIKAQRYLSGSAPGPSVPLDVDYIMDAFPPPPAAPSTFATEPSRTRYNAMVDAEEEIVAEDSRLSRWMGNIWLRQTRYVIAK